MRLAVMMRNMIIAFCSIGLLATIMSFRNTTQFEPIAVVELFTSQGCSSCPAADKLLSQTIHEAKTNGRKIFALSFHVDYWNRLGWSDPFSDKKYSQRQNEYASSMQLQSVYTPQIIVNGTSEFVGSNQKSLGSALAKSLEKNPTAVFKNFTATIHNGEATNVKYELDGKFIGCKINFALVSLNETTSILNGENGGRILKSENIVRQFISIPAKSTGEFNFEKKPVPAINNIAIIGFIQRSDLQIIGAAMAELE